MAKVEYADAIKTVSGALTKINKKSPHAADQKMVLATHRVAETTNPNCSRIYLRGLSSVSRSTPFSQNEKDNMYRFSAIARAVSARMKNLSQQAADQAAFKAQKETGFKTMRSYLWSLEAESYDEQNG